VNVVFDFGNVLMDWKPVQLVETHFSAGLPSGMSARAFVEQWVGSDWIAFDNGELTQEELLRSLSARIGCDASALRAFVETIPHVLPPIESSIAVMETLFDARDRGDDLRVFYLSNMPAEFADTLEKRFAWIKRFDGGIFSGRAKLSKPDSAIYAALEAQHFLDPQRTLFLDDSSPNVVAANGRGWHTIHVQTPNDVVAGLHARGLPVLPRSE
jgi:putative hydrolase of the HAD superfamily